MLKVNQNMDIYNDQIDQIESEYIETLLDPNDIKDYNVFTGLIKAISIKCKFNQDIKIYESIDYVQELWDRYTQLVYKYKQKPTIEEFALMLNIHKDTLYAWANSETRAGDYSEKLSMKRSDVIRKILEEAKMGRYKGAQAGNVGCIFLCKAVDHLVETAPAPIAEIDKRERLSLESSRKEFEVFQIEKKD